MDHLAKQLKITDYEGWYRISTTTLKQWGGEPVLHKYNASLSKLLQTVYPEYHETNVHTYDADISGIPPNFIMYRKGIGIT